MLAFYLWRRENETSSKSLLGLFDSSVAVEEAIGDVEVHDEQEEEIFLTHNLCSLFPCSGLFEPPM